MRAIRMDNIVVNKMRLVRVDNIVIYEMRAIRVNNIVVYKIVNGWGQGLKITGYEPSIVLD